MRLYIAIPFLLITAVATAQNSEGPVRKAIERSTLDQPGTKPFHLKAQFAPSFERDRDSNRNGTVEIWWASPTQWKKELSGPGIHLLEVKNGNDSWQKTEGDYLPEWLRELSVALVRPVPDIPQTLARVKTAEMRVAFNNAYFSWMEFSTDGSTQKAMGAGITINSNSGLLSHGSGLGWAFSYEDYSDFHGRMVPKSVTSGGPGPEVKAKVSIEDLSNPSPMLFAAPPSPDANPLRGVVIDELAIRKNLEMTAPPSWPAIKDGPLEGALTTEIVVDREGKVHEVDTPVTDNPGLSEEARQYILSMKFKPVLLNGQPVQAISRITMPFKTARPAGMESFRSAREYFEHARQLSSVAASTNAVPYVLHASFQTGTKDGLATGEYTDTFAGATQWRREITLKTSHFGRARNGDKWYQWSDGPDATLLSVILTAVEPVPAIDTFVESDWRISREILNGSSLIRIASGHESQDGKLDPQSRGYWVNDKGILQNAHFRSLEVSYLKPEEFHGVQVPRHIEVSSSGRVALLFDVTSLEPHTSIDSKAFTVKGHDWKRQFTAEAR